MNLGDLLSDLLKMAFVNGILFETPDLLISLIPHSRFEFDKVKTLMSSFLSFLDYLGVIDRSQGLIRLTDTGKSLWRLPNPRKRCLTLIELLRSRHEGFSRLMGTLGRVGRISKNRLRIYAETFPQWELALTGLIWMEDYGLIELDSQGDYVLTEMGSELLSEVHAEVEGREEGPPPSCPFPAYVRTFPRFVLTEEYASLRQRKDLLIELGKKLKAPTSLEESELKDVLREFIINAFTMEWASDSLDGYVRELTGITYVSSLRRFLSEVISKSLELPKEKVASVFEIFPEKLTPLATELLTAIDPLRFGVYDERVYRLVTRWDDLDLEIFDRQAPHHEGLSADYYVPFLLMFSLVWVL